MNLRRAIDTATGAVVALACAVAILAITAAATGNETPQSAPQEIAADFGLTVVWFTDESPCGAVDEMIGCYDSDTPDVIYIAEGMDADKERSVILHEIGHALHDRLGLPIDECAADQFAASMGATYLPHDC